MIRFFKGVNSGLEISLKGIDEQKRLYLRPRIIFIMTHAEEDASVKNKPKDANKPQMPLKI